MLLFGAWDWTSDLGSTRLTTPPPGSQPLHGHFFSQFLLKSTNRATVYHMWPIIYDNRCLGRNFWSPKWNHLSRILPSLWMHARSNSFAYECFSAAVCCVFTKKASPKPLAAVITSSKNTMGEYESRKHRCCVGLRAQREGRRLLSPFQLMCGMGGPFGERRCQPRQTAALGSAPDLTESSPSISHIVWVSEGVCALLAVTLTRRHKLFLSRCSLMHLSLIPPPCNNTKTKHMPARVLITRARMHSQRLCAVSFTGSLGNVNQY